MEEMNIKEKKKVNKYYKKNGIEKVSPKIKWKR